MDAPPLLPTPDARHVAWSVPGRASAFGSQHKEVTLSPMAPNRELTSVSAAEKSSLARWLTKTSSVQVDGRQGAGVGEGSSGLLLTSSSLSSSNLYQITLESRELADLWAWTAVLGM